MARSGGELTGNCEAEVEASAVVDCSAAGAAVEADDEAPLYAAAEISMDGGGACRRKGRCSKSRRPDLLANDVDGFDDDSL